MSVGLFEQIGVILAGLIALWLWKGRLARWFSRRGPCFLKIFGGNYSRVAAVQTFWNDCYPGVRRPRGVMQSRVVAEWAPFNRMCLGSPTPAKASAWWNWEWDWKRNREKNRWGRSCSSLYGMASCYFSNSQNYFWIANSNWAFAGTGSCSLWLGQGRCAGRFGGRACRYLSYRNLRWLLLMKVRWMIGCVTWNCRLGFGTRLSCRFLVSFLFEKSVLLSQCEPIHSNFGPFSFSFWASIAAWAAVTAAAIDSYLI